MDNPDSASRAAQHGGMTLAFPRPVPARADRRSSAQPSASVDPGTHRTILRCNSTADFLAALPFLTGFRATNSLVIVLFSGRRAGSAMRVDLPDPNAPETFGSMLDCIVEILHRTGAGPAGPAIVITTNRTFSEAAGAPWWRFARQIRLRFRREGWPLRDLAVIAPDGWAGLLTDRMPQRGRPLAEIDASPMTARATAAGASSDSFEELGRLPEPSARRAAAVTARLAELDRRAAAGGDDANATAGRGTSGTPIWVGGLARVANACLDGEGAPEPLLVARLIRASEQTDPWLVLLLASISRADFVVDLVEQAAPRRFLGAPIDTGAESGSGDHDWSIRTLLQVLARERIDTTRLRRLIEVLGDATVHAPRARRPGLFALLAWAWWMRGMSSVASRVLAESQGIDAEHALSLMVARLVAEPPSWTLRAAVEAVS
ncbi:hypothetical protein LEUCIP111803_01419 [Leucobacter soli]|uniref:DUF4192 family protein n=2 Tax=Leucobacter soli TaxID=2812850 RepID=A0A916JXB0_9MICO|nr:hypothetical protein LEUCIP111803_01419 [Leucobacter soli]